MQTNNHEKSVTNLSRDQQEILVNMVRDDLNKVKIGLARWILREKRPEKIQDVFYDVMNGFLTKKDTFFEDLSVKYKGIFDDDTDYKMIFKKIYHFFMVNSGELSICQYYQAEMQSTLLAYRNEQTSIAKERPSFRISSFLQSQETEIVKKKLLVRKKLLPSQFVGADHFWRQQPSKPPMTPLQGKITQQKAAPKWPSIELEEGLEFIDETPQLSLLRSTVDKTLTAPQSKPAISQNPKDAQDLTTPPESIGFVSVVPRIGDLGFSNKLLRAVQTEDHLPLTSTTDTSQVNAEKPSEVRNDSPPRPLNLPVSNTPEVHYEISSPPPSESTPNSTSTPSMDVESLETPEIDSEQARADKIIKEQEKEAQAIYSKLSNVVLDRINSYNRSDTYQKQHAVPFTESIRVFNGVFCTPLPLNDARKIIELIDEAAGKINVTSKMGDIFCQSVKKFFTDYNVFFLNKYFRSGFSDVGYLTNPEVAPIKRRFSFNLKKEHLKLHCLELELQVLSKNNHRAVVEKSKAARGVAENVIQTLVYNQAKIILNVNPEEHIDEFTYKLVCLLQPPNTERKSDICKPDETIVQLILVRARSNNRLDAFFEVSKLLPESDEYNIALQMCAKLSKSLQDLLLFQGNEYSKEDLITKEFTILSSQQFVSLIDELTNNNNEESSVLPLFSFEKIRDSLEPNKPDDDNQEDARKYKKRKKSSEQKKLQLHPASFSNKKQKVRSGNAQVVNIEHANNESGQNLFNNLFDYLDNLQRANLRKVTQISEKVARSVIQSFDHNKMIKKVEEPLEVVEREKLQEFLNSTSLYPYQKESVTRLITAYYSNIGLGLYDEMSLGKTVQMGAVLRYLTKQTPDKFYLVVVPLQVIIKWRNELLTKLSFAENEVIIYHGQRREIRTKTLQSSTVVITTVDTLVSELKSQQQTNLQSALGYITTFSFADLSPDTINAWLKISSQLDEIVGCQIIKINKKRIKFLRYPTQKELRVIKEKSGISVLNLKILFSCELIFQQLNKKGYINKNGAILRELTNIEELNSLYNEFPELFISQEDLFVQLQSAFNEFSVGGIVFDEAHQGLSKSDTQSFIYISPIAKNIANRGGLRATLTGTPFVNNIEELWTLNEFLNPGHLLSKNEFMAAYENLILNTARTICQTAELIQTEDLDHFNQVLKKSVASAKKAYNELQKIVEKFQQKQIRRTKEFIGQLGCQETNSSNNYRVPNRNESVISWNLSPKQQEIFNALDMNLIENACRSFAFFHHAGEKEFTRDNDKMKGYVLLQHLSKIFDHPILVSIAHADKLFKDKCKFQSMVDYISKIIQEEYDNDAMKFVNESGKLTQLINVVLPLLDDPRARILISTEFIPVAAMIQVVLTTIKGSLQPLVYSGSVKTQEREDLLKKFNSTDSSNNNTYPVIIVSQRAGSEGIELYANYVVAYDQTWTDALREQIKGRALRNGSPFENVTCITLQGDNPLDKKMTSFVTEKMEWGRWFVDANADCNLLWFIDRLKSLIKTTSLFSQTKASNEKIDHAVAQIKLQLETEEELSLRRLVANRNVNAVVASEPSVNNSFANTGNLVEACTNIGFLASNRNVQPELSVPCVQINTLSMEQK